MKHRDCNVGAVLMGRAPHGARGLKRKQVLKRIAAYRSRPARGAWIETYRRHNKISKIGSRPARGAWIETLMRSTAKKKRPVAPRTGRVD